MFQKELDILGQDSKAKYGLSSSAFHAANLPAALELCGKPLPIDSHSDAAVLKDKYQQHEYFKSTYV